MYIKYKIITKYIKYIRWSEFYSVSVTYRTVAHRTIQQRFLFLESWSVFRKAFTVTRRNPYKIWKAPIEPWKMLLYFRFLIKAWRVSYQEWKRNLIIWIVSRFYFKSTPINGEFSVFCTKMVKNFNVTGINCDKSKNEKRYDFLVRNWFFQAKSR